MERVADPQGNYSVELNLGNQALGVAGIGQAGQVPQDAKSLRFYSRRGVFGPDPGIKLSFGGTTLPLFDLSEANGTHLYGANLSIFAGQTAELRFDASAAFGASGSAIIDNIQFSTQVVPEPGTATLMILGGILILCRIASARVE